MIVATIVGARPQFIKAAPLSATLRSEGIQEYLVHTGQHYDQGLSKVFFEDLAIPEPDVNLGVGSGPHGWQTGQILERVERVLQEVVPDWVVVFGDTNSTLAGALAACKLRLALAHVEAGLRSYNRDMPEEHNRVLTDHCADLLLCPTEQAVDNLRREGLIEGVRLVGDPMYDAALRFAERAAERSTALEDLGLTAGDYYLATVHRPQNTDDPEALAGIMSALVQLDRPVVFPVHPRTRKCLDELPPDWPGSGEPDDLLLIEPVGYLDMLSLTRNARLVLTDSGGLQKEAYFYAVPCVTLRDETEWVETVEAGWNVLAGAAPNAILEAVNQHAWPSGRPARLYGDGAAASAIVAELKSARRLRLRRVT